MKVSTKREVFRAPDVCELAQLQPYVLRSWESEFPALGQGATGSGPRVYRRADVEMVLRIKQLVFGEGLTLAGARRRLEEQESEPSVAAATVDDVLDDMARSRLRQVRSGLEAIMRMLSRDAPRPAPPDLQPPELQLVPPSPRPANGRARAASKPSATPARRSAKRVVKNAGGKGRRAS